ncbi:helix-turn-helix domain-containing protein [Salmonella enterica]|nr:helix-turn-helix domain-containing protein [Salmonella enterica subsp. enterica serovar Newport]EBP1502399.1 helix-turn-helix domain-containing protein [Salmonella enterica]
MKELPKTGYVTFGFLAGHFSVATNTIHRWVREGYIPPPLYLSDGTSRFNAADIHAWIEKQKKEQSELKKRRVIRNKLMVEARNRKAMEKASNAT